MHWKKKYVVNVLPPISEAILRARMPPKRIRSTTSSAGSTKTGKGESLNTCKNVNVCKCMHVCPRMIKWKK